jgi:hypothetical protein
MPDDTRLSDSKRVEQLNRSVGVSADADRPRTRVIAAAVPQQVDDDNAMTGRDERHDLGPEVAGGREAVNQHDGLAGATRTSRVVVQAHPIQVDELAPHRGERMAARPGRHKQALGRRLRGSPETADARLVYTLIKQQLTDVRLGLAAYPLASLGKCAIVTPPNRTLLLATASGGSRCGCLQPERECDCPGNTERVTTATVRPVDGGVAAVARAGCSGPVPAGVDAG